MHKFFNFCASLLPCILLICGCVTSPPTHQFPEITFKHLQIINVDVAKVEVENRFHPPLTDPHIEHLLPNPPARAMEQWLRDRFQPVGLSGTLRLIIEDARATGTELKLDKSFKGQLLKQQSQLYEMAAQGTLQLKGSNGKILGTATAKVERSITTREDISLNDRHKLWLETVSELMNDFNQSIEPNIQSYLGRWLR